MASTSCATKSTSDLTEATKSSTSATLPAPAPSTPTTAKGIYKPLGAALLLLQSGACITDKKRNRQESDGSQNESSPEEQHKRKRGPKPKAKPGPVAGATLNKRLSELESKVIHQSALLKNELLRLTEQVKRLELENAVLHQRVEKLETAVNALDSTKRDGEEGMEHSQSSEHVRLFSELLKANISDSTNASLAEDAAGNACSNVLPVSDIVSKLVSKVSERVHDKVRSENLRSSNVMLIGVQSSQVVTDEQQVGSIFRTMGKERQVIAYSRRLGKSEFAPILCKLTDSAQRNSVLAAARKLKGTEYDKVFIRPDLSSEEREEEKKLRQERDSRNSKSGDGRQRQWWRLRDGRLVPCVFDAPRAQFLSKAVNKITRFVANGSDASRGPGPN